MADFVNIQEVLQHLNIKENMTASEFGCGSADIAIALAKALSKGSVYALDIQQEKLSALKSKLAFEKLKNVSTILCDLEAPNGSSLKDNSQDVVVIPNVLFQAENKSGIISEAKRILVSGGQLLIIDWFKNAPFGPKDDTVTPDEIKGMAEVLDLLFKKEFAASNHHFALLFTKK